MNKMFLGGHAEATLCLAIILQRELVYRPSAPSMRTCSSTARNTWPRKIIFRDHNRNLRIQECFARIESVEESVDNAVNAVRFSTTKPSEQQEAAKAGDELKGVIKVQNRRIEKAYERLHQSIKTGNTIESDVRQNELHKEVLDLQQNFDKKLPQTLKKHLDVTEFQNRDRRPPRAPAKIVSNDRK